MDKEEHYELLQVLNNKAYTMLSNYLAHLLNAVDEAEREEEEYSFLIPEIGSLIILMHKMENM